MFREFNVKFEDVEMLGGADNLLEGTEITKVIVRGDNNKMSSLDSMLKNCNELDTVDGELDLNGVSDIDNLLEGTELVKSIDLKNINNENITANNSFPHVDQINIGGELYNKKAMQNVISSKDWTFDNINYSGTVGDNIVIKEVNIVDDNKVTIRDTLEQKARGFEIIGQTYENLVVGSGEVALLDELTLESVDGSTKEFNPHLEQPICVETIEGETYQNLIEGKGEYKLTDAIDERTISESEIANGIENLPSVIEITSLWGNTYQNPNNLNEIVSLGDLYVDEGGEPILDEEGNEQYKLELISNDGNSNSNKTTILMPQPLRMLRKYGGLNSDLFDKLYWDSSANKYYIENNIYKLVIKRVNDSLYNGTYFGNIQLDNVEGIDIGFLHKQRTVMPFIQKMTYTGWGNRPTNSDFGVGVYSDGDIRIYGKEGISTTPDEMNKFIGDGLDFFIERQTPRIIETKILEKPSLETYSPKTYISTNTEIQPSQMTVTNKRNLIDLKKMKANTDYTVQLKCNEKGNKPIKINLCGREKDIDATIGVNHVNITTNELNDNKLELSGEGNIVSEIIVVEGEMNQYPKYFNGVQSTGELQDDGTYKIGIKTNEGFNISIQTNNPLAKGDKLYWNKSNKRYEIDRGGSIEVPTVSGDVIDLPRLYQRENTNFTIESGNIKPSKTSINYLDID